MFAKRSLFHACTRACCCCRSPWGCPGAAAGSSCWVSAQHQVPVIRSLRLAGSLRWLEMLMPRFPASLLDLTQLQPAASCEAAASAALLHLALPTLAGLPRLQRRHSHCSPAEQAIGRGGPAAGWACCLVALPLLRTRCFAEATAVASCPAGRLVTLPSPPSLRTTLEEGC